jgi:hypothetical protein
MVCLLSLAGTEMWQTIVSWLGNLLGQRSAHAATDEGYGLAGGRVLCSAAFLAFPMPTNTPLTATGQTLRARPFATASARGI